MVGTLRIELRLAVPQTAVLAIILRTPYVWRRAEVSIPIPLTRYLLFSRQSPGPPRLTLRILVGEVGFEPTQPKDTRFTVWPNSPALALPDIMYGRGGRTRTHDGQLTSALEAVAIAAMRLPYIFGADAQGRTETIQRIGRLSKPLRYHYATSALERTMLLT